ncbi:MAG: energy transducer TonB [Fibrobacterota bacterium]
MFSVFAAAAIFSVIPAVHGFFVEKTQDPEKAAAKGPVIMEKTVKNEKPKRPLQRRVRKITSQRSSRKSEFSMRFTPDLGVSGGGAEVSKSGFGKNVFAESEVDELPRPMGRTSVTYPRRARDAGMEGEVSLILLIGRSGNVLGVNVESSPGSLLHGPVVENVRSWKFIPAKKGGVPVKVRMRQDIKFDLDN